VFKQSLCCYLDVGPKKIDDPSACSTIFAEYFSLLAAVTQLLLPKIIFAMVLKLPVSQFDLGAKRLCANGPARMT
jgi:hypothetical protein